MRRFEVTLTAQMTGFLELVVEAESEEEAKVLALQEGSKAHVHDWVVQYINYYGDRNQYQEIEVNEIGEVPSV